LHLRRLDPVTGLVLPERLKPAGTVLVLTGSRISSQTLLGEDDDGREAF
jgi:hypothetical protein